jgi:uncharacterized protein YecT (DUF1311 family)
MKSEFVGLAFALVLLSPFGPSLAAQSTSAAPPDPIDVAYQACLANSEPGTVVGLLMCNGEASQAWQREMEKALGDLKAKLEAPPEDPAKPAYGPDAVAKLMESQERWLDYFDADDQVMDIYWTFGGTLAPVAAGFREIDQVRARTMALRSLLARY